MKAHVRADAEPKKGTVLGTYEGKSADALVENNNQMTLGPKLWKNLFSSDEYKMNLQRGMYIGFLGHPEDVGCQDYQHGCIVMREGKYLDDSGEVWARFDLIDTPVGRIVKAFQDAGVTFGISVRGAGDIDANGEVDPDTFVFRGFDLVTFPAYDDAVPKFTEIAASEDIDKQVKYKSICSAINKNIDAVTSATTIEVLQDTVGKNSKPYEALQHRKEEIEAGSKVEPMDISTQKIQGLTELYLEQVKANRQLEVEMLKLQKQNKVLSSEVLKVQRQIKSSERIMNEQLQAITASNEELEGKYKTAVTANTRLKETLSKVKADNEKECNQLKSQADRLQSQIKASNLNYQQKMNSKEAKIQTQSETISKLEQKLQETVLAASKAEKGTSNLDAKVRRLESEVLAATNLVEQYQQAYADLYASALGVHLSNISINASTTVDELKEKISSGTSTCNIPVAPAIDDSIDIVDDEEDDGESLVLA